MRNVTDRVSNPFDMCPDCEQFVPGYGDANADFHVIGDHPGIHGGVDTGVPFTGTTAGTRLLDALQTVGLLRSVDDRPEVDRTFLSYLHMCVSSEVPDEDSYADLEPFFDAELRAIAAHVLLPVGSRATNYVLRNYTARAWKTQVDMDELHATELRGSGWLVVPIKDPSTWEAGDADALVERLDRLLATDYRQESDLGRFLPGGDPYLVR